MKLKRQKFGKLINYNNIKIYGFKNTLKRFYTFEMYFYREVDIC